MKRRVSFFIACFFVLYCSCLKAEMYEGCWGLALMREEGKVILADRIGSIFLVDALKGGIHSSFPSDVHSSYGFSTGHVRLSRYEDFLIAALPSSDYGNAILRSFPQCEAVCRVKESGIMNAGEGPSIPDLEPDGRPPEDAVFSPSGRFLVAGTCSVDSGITLFCYDTRRGQRLTETVFPDIKTSRPLLISSHPGKHVIALFTGDSIALVKYPAFKKVQERRLPEKFFKNASCRWLSFSPGGEAVQAVFCREGGEAFFAGIGLETDSLAVYPLTGWTDKVLSVTISRNGKWLATGGTEKVVIWDTRSFKPRSSLRISGGSVRGLSFCREGAEILVGTDATRPSGISGEHALLSRYEAISGKHLQTLVKASPR